MAKKIQSLVRFNLKMGALHALQAAAILVLSTEFYRTVTVEYLRFNESTQELEPYTRDLFDMQIAPLVALFFIISAVAHLSIATVGRKSYTRNLKKGMNPYRWFEYSVSAALMIVLIAVLAGIFNIIALLGLFALTAVMNLMGYMMEVHNQTTKKTSWISYNIGVLAGIVPWVGIAIALWASETASGGQVPGFVYGIFVSLFLFFNTFAINMWLQYKQIGKWKDYLYGERVYIILSLVAKSALAWQIFAGTLQP